MVVSTSDLILLTCGVFGLLTVRFQIRLIFDLFRHFTFLHGNCTALAFFSTAEKILKFPSLLLMCLFYSLMLVSLSLYSNGFHLFLFGLWGFIFLVPVFFIGYRIFRYIAFVVLHITNAISRSIILTLYFEDALPLAVVACTTIFSVVLIIYVFFDLILGTSYVGQQQQVNFFESIFVVILMLGFVGPVRDVLGGLTLLADGYIQLGDLVQVRGVAGKVVRVGVFNVTLKVKAQALAKIPNREFLIEIWNNHSRADGHMAHFFFQVVSRHSTEELRNLKRDLERFLLFELGIGSFEVNLLLNNSITKSRLSTSAKALRGDAEYDSNPMNIQPPAMPCKPKLPAFKVSWCCKYLVYEKYVKARSEVLLGVRTFLAKKSIQAV